MSNFQEVIRIKVKKCNGLLQPEYKKLCVDPQITSFEMLQHLLSKAFDCQNMEFTLSYLSTISGAETYVPLLSDWDLDAAFASSSDPWLRLKLDLKPFEEGLEDWELIQSKPTSPFQALSSIVEKNSLLGSITETISSQVEKTVSQVTKVIGFSSEENEPDVQLSNSIEPLSDQHFHMFMDPVGHMVRQKDFRLRVYSGGVEHSLRKVVWRHLLNVYPDEMTGRERFDYFRKRTDEYCKLRDEWRQLAAEQNQELHAITTAVRKDVLRTDRTFKFYAGSDDNANVIALFNLLVTYAVTHPDVSYCQGMSDLASPILAIEEDESHAYICFCGLMERLKPSFNLDGVSMATKFTHLSLLIRHYEPEFWAYLKHVGAEDLFFCYRWLLLELKREFPFQETLLMLEVMWASLKPNPPVSRIALYDPNYSFSKLKAHCECGSPSDANQAYLRLQSRCRPHPNLSLELEKLSVSEQSKSLCAENSTKSSRYINSLEAITPGGDDDKYIDSQHLVQTETRKLVQASSSLDESLKNSLNGSAPTSPLPVSLLNNSCPPKHTENVSSSQFFMPNPETNSSSDEKVFPYKSFSDSTLTSHPCENPASQSHNTNQTVVFDSGLNSSLPSSLKAKDKSCSSTFYVRLDSESDSTDATIPLLSSSTDNKLDSVLESPNKEFSVKFPAVSNDLPELPPSHELGDGNPFLLFMCVVLLRQQKDAILKARMDFNEMAMHFNRMVRRHDVKSTIIQAQALYSSYIKSQTNNKENSETKLIDGVSV